MRSQSENEHWVANCERRDCEETDASPQKLLEGGNCSLGNHPGNRDEPTSAELSEDSQTPSKRGKLKSAVRRLKTETRNALLLQAVLHYTQVRMTRDNLLVRVALLDPLFAEVLLKAAQEERRIID